MGTRVRGLLPLYLVVFVGFLGYSLMIAVFTPMILRDDNGMLPVPSSLGSAKRCPGDTAGAVSVRAVPRLADPRRSV